MKGHFLRLQPISLSRLALAAAASFAFAGSALADPPDLVARLSYQSGTVTFDPAGTTDWVNADVNRPLTTGDSLWVDASSRAELNMGRVVLRADSQTSVTITNLDDQVAQFQLAQGTILLHIRSMNPGDIYEIDTPNLAFTINQPGKYRLTVTPDGQTTYVLVRQGDGTATGDNQSYAINAGQSYAFSGSDLSNYTYYDPPAADDLDRFADDRDQRFDHATSSRYVAQGVIGSEDLDANGTWQTVDGYGSVWVPTTVAVGWAPYQDGHWAWVSPWGWTWVDAAPWGFAPFHYGRWAHADFGWCWVPGPIAVAPVYAPALVAFVGGPGFAIGVSGGVGVAWFPLGPRDVYRPGYEVSPAYVQRVNVSNTTVTNTYVTNVYNNTTTVRYANQTVPSAVTAVPSAAFAGGQPVARAAVTVPAGEIARAQVTAVAPVAPTGHAVTGPGTVSTARPAAAVMQRPVIARTAPPPPPVPFAAKQAALAANPGHPLAPAAEEQLRRSTTIAQPQAAVHVVKAPVQPAAPPPARAAGAPARPSPAGAPGAARPGLPAERQMPAPAARPPGLGTPGPARPDLTPRPPEPVARPDVTQPRGQTPVPAQPGRPDAVPPRVPPAPAQQARPEGQSRAVPAERKGNEPNEKKEHD
jgi:hypothetical protein